MDLFHRQWSSYRAIVTHNLMEHREVAEATAEAIEGWLVSRAASRPAPRMVDLGCGDLALLPPLLRRLPLAGYAGLDLTAAVLPLAAQALGPVPYPTRWQQGELLAWALAQAAQPATASGAAIADRGPEIGPSADDPIDILHAAFAIHHLTDDQKAAFLAAARRRISGDGVFVWADVFRDPGESRQAYVERYSQRVQGGWDVLDAEQRDHVIEHLSSFDIPAERGTIEAIAEAAGWRWRWTWQGAHRAEAVAVLTPA